MTLITTTLLNRLGHISDNMKTAESIIPKKGQLRIREWQNWWFAESWNGLTWEYIHGASTEEELRGYFEWLNEQEKVKNSATD